MIDREHHQGVVRRALVISAALPAVMLVAALVPSASPARDLPVHAASEARVFLPLAAVRLHVEWLPDVEPATPVLPATETPTLEPSPTIEPSPTPTETPSATATPTGYWEPLTDFADIDDLKTSYDASRWYETMLTVLERRYPTGRYIVTHLDDSQTNAARWASGNTGTWGGLMWIMQLVVHEMGHQLDMQEGVMKTGFQQWAYVVRDDRTVVVTNHDTFARSEIARYVTGDLVNMYKNTYLTGTSGRQGFLNLLDELNEYTHSLFVAYGLHDQFPSGQRSSHRDGLVTFMMYTEFYLRVGRQSHPDDYAELQNDPEVRDLVELLWGRANFILDTTESIPNLAMDPAAVEAEMRKADMQAELEMFLNP